MFDFFISPFISPKVITKHLEWWLANNSHTQHTCSSLNGWDMMKGMNGNMNEYQKLWKLFRPKEDVLRSAHCASSPSPLTRQGANQGASSSLTEPVREFWIYPRKLPALLGSSQGTKASVGKKVPAVRDCREREWNRKSLKTPDSTEPVGNGSKLLP